MFVEGTTVHSPEYLAQVAREFQTWHWPLRLGSNAVAAVSAFVAFLDVYRAAVERRRTSPDGHRTPSHSHASVTPSHPSAGV